MSVFISAATVAVVAGDKIREYCGEIFDDGMVQQLYYVVFSMSCLRLYYEILTLLLGFAIYSNALLFVWIFFAIVLPCIAAWAVKQLIDDWSIFIVTVLQLINTGFIGNSIISICLRFLTLYICKKRIIIFDNRYVVLLTVFLMII